MVRKTPRLSLHQFHLWPVRLLLFEICLNLLSLLIRLHTTIKDILLHIHHLTQRCLQSLHLHLHFLQWHLQWHLLHGLEMVLLMILWHWVLVILCFNNSNKPTLLFLLLVLLPLKDFQQVQQPLPPLFLLRIVLFQNNHFHLPLIGNLSSQKNHVVSNS